MRASGIKRLPMDAAGLVGKVSAEDVIDENTGEVLINCNEDVNEEHLLKLRQAGIKTFKILFIDDFNVGPFLRNTLLQDKLHTPEEALLEIYRRLRPGDPPTPETAKNLFESLFFKPERYDLSTVGRLKLNHKFNLDESLMSTVLTTRDIMETVKYLVELRNGRGQIDDIDHLGNRRVRAVGELMENQYRIGLVRMERAIKERMSMSQEMDALMPADLINAKPVSAVVKEYFASSQLSQFMDQTNPLSEVTHKRRLSALGPAASRASAPASKSATSTRPTTAASARSRPRKARTSASSRRSRPTPASTSSASSRPRTARSTAASPARSSRSTTARCRRPATTSPRPTPPPTRPAS
jgi:DNA-directed RNA polymerase subunit beta